MRSDVNVRDANGKTALHHLMYACRDPEETQVERVRTLLEARADITIKSGNGETAQNIFEFVKKKETKHVQEIRDMISLQN